MLKFDDRRIEGSPNFRRAPLALRLVSSPASPGSESDGIDFVAAQADKWVCGRYVTIRRSLSVNAHEWIAVACQLWKGEY